MDDAHTARILSQLQSAQAAEAWAEFLELFSPLILQVIRLQEHDADSVADCYLYACEQLCRDRFRRLGRFQPDGPASFRTWLSVVVRNLGLDWRRRKYGRDRPNASLAPGELGLLGSARSSGSELPAESLGLEDVEVPDGQPDPEAQAVAGELKAFLSRAVARLENSDRLLLHFRFEQGLTLEQVARIAGLADAQTADRRIRSILARLRKEIG